MADKKIDEPTGVETTGHSWDGIEELNNPLPRWWLWTLYATIIWAIGYTIAYPAWPMISGATKGALGYSTRGQVAVQIAEHDAQNEGLVAELIAADLAELPPTSDLHRYAVARGASVFRAQCSQCHGSGAAGAVGYPNLLDNDWLWGGDIENISATIAHGVRNATDDDARYSEMPAFDEILEDEEIGAVVEYVASLSASEFDASLAETGAEVFADNCSACHGETAEGDRDMGAPNLADAIWLYGGDRDTLEQTVRYSRYGVMPAWGQRLRDEDVRAVSVYVHALGGGE
ncbi:Cbb3-type cytochrome c oxidase subunit [Sulfitobacter noctilucicola]|uniref:Cbb3-type cytochrome c oxidase subunit n=1 Tax=Sulfitobacter noctilucicola TaxID=1342301 RepID=A0A7W6MB04_9RHOB|nr:cytochrome-c oxidase, cbb3-type subunit III [Sulfitobacter noctilucicola]KIN64193.1 Cbb3-type cytochrome c oxidase subunit [Sulfitobacter noctilucicola]MBB4175546.1 cytochrome c oxidase cbb3-type subunit 3 [Sulfitobacter noctilucicola]